MPFGQDQDTELWNNQFPETKIVGLPVSRRMRGLVYMASRDKVDVDTFHKGIQYALEKLGKSKFGFERTAVSNFKSKRHEGSGNELVDYSRLSSVSWCRQKGTWALGTRLLKKVEIIEKPDVRAHTTSILLAIQSKRSFSKFNNTSRNNWKP